MVLKKLIKSKGMSQNQLSHAANIPASNLSLIVNNKLVPCPAWKTRIARALEMDEAVLFPVEEVIG